jgi:hypothetical protein
MSSIVQGKENLFFSIRLTTIIGLLLLIIAAYYCPPNAEDLALSIAPRNQGKATSIINLLSFFDSRYTANVLHAFNPLVWGFFNEFYILPLLCIASVFFSIRFFLGSILCKENCEIGLWWIALIITITYFGIVPSLPFSLFYMSSTFTYTYPVVFWLLWTGCLLRSYHSMGLNHALLSISGFLFLIFSFGSSELFIAINGLTLLTALILCYPINKQRFFIALPYFLVALACLAFLYFMPSQKFTSEKIYGDLDERYKGSNFIFSSITLFGLAWVKSIFNPFVALVMLSFIPFFSRLRFKFNFLSNLKRIEIMGLFFLIQISSLLITWPYMIARGSLYEHPVYIFNVAIFISMLGTFLILVISNNYYIQLQKNIFSNNKFLNILSILLPISLLFLSPNYSLVLSDWRSGKLADLHKYHQELYTSIATIKKHTQRPWIAYFPQCQNPPASIWLDGDLLPNRQNQDWNSAYEVYFDIDELRLPEDTIFKN